MMDARALLEADEGRKRLLYRDTQGKLSIGIGYDIDDNGLPDAIIDQLFDLTYATALAAAGRVFDAVIDPTNPRHAAITDMAFELGETGLQGFIQLRACWKRGDWEGAAEAVQSSRYAVQVPNRAKRIEALLRTGDWASLATIS